MLWLDNEKAYKFLIEKGSLVVLRPQEKHEGKQVFRNPFNISDQQEVILILLKKIEMLNKEAKKDLEEFVWTSGFSSVDEWLENTKPSDIYYLYSIYLVKKK